MNRERLVGTLLPHGVIAKARWSHGCVCHTMSAPMGSASSPTYPSYSARIIPTTAEIVSGGKRFALQNVRFAELGDGQWQIEFNLGAQDETMALIEIVRGGGGSLMLSIDGGPVVGAHSRLRPRYQTILTQPVRYDFAWP